MAEPLLVALVALAAGVVVLAPLRHRAAPPPDDRLERASTRYRLALETLRDAEAERRAGALDTADHAEEVRAAEERAARALAELEALRSATNHPAPDRPAPGPAPDRLSPVGAATAAGRATGRARRIGLGAAVLIGAAVVIGSVIPAPVGLAARTVVDERLAATRAAEEARQQRIDELRARLSSDPSDPDALSELADEYLAGTSSEDLARAATALLLIIGLDPDDESAHRRIIGAYMRAGDYVNAAAALDAYAELDPHPADLAFLRGLLALRGHGDPATAVREFDRFLELAPEDERAPMVRALRNEAASQADR